MSMLRAGKVAGVHRTTIARWFDRKWIAKYDRLVDIDEVNAVKEAQLPLEPVPLTQLELPAGPIADNQPQLASKPLPKAPTQARSKQPLQTQPLKQVEFAL